MLDAESLSTLCRHRAHSGPVCALSVAPSATSALSPDDDDGDDGGLILTGSVRGSVRVWRRKGSESAASEEAARGRRGLLPHQQQQREQESSLVLLASLPCHK